MGNSGFAAIRRQYEFRSIGIGNWVTAEEQRRAAPRFASALEDLKAMAEYLASLPPIKNLVISENQDSEQDW